MNEVPMQDIQLAGGWKDASMPLHYLHFSDDYKIHLASKIKGHNVKDG